MMFCRYYQRSIERELDKAGSIARTGVLGHIAKCPACRQYYEALTELGEQLESASSCQLSEGQLNQIECAVFERLSDESLSQVALGGYRQGRPVGHWRALCTAAAIVLVALAGLWMQLTHQKPMQEDPLADFGNQSEQIRRQVPLMTCLVEQSMQGEIQKLTGDARNAINFLKNCAPAGTAELISLSDKNTLQNTGQ